MKENGYQAKLITKLEREFPGCVIILNDPRLRQGIPDLLILFEDTWAMLEVKLSRSSPIRPNQTHYVETYGEMSYCAFIYPEIEERVFDELSHAFGNRRQTRLLKSK